MNLLAHLLIIASFIGYLSGVIAGGMLTFRPRAVAPHRWRFLTNVSSLLAVIPLSLVLGLLVFATAGQFERAAVYYVAVLLLIEGVCAAVGLRSPRDRVWVSSAGLAVLGAMSVVSHVTPHPLVPSTGALPAVLATVHLVSAVVAEGCLALIAIVAAAAVAADRRIRLLQIVEADQRELSLVRIDRVYGVLIVGGFVAMTASVASGGVWSLVSHARSPSDVTIYFGLVSWAILGALVHLRFVASWSVVRTSRVVSVVVPLVFVTYVAMALTRGELFHQQWGLRTEVPSRSNNSDGSR